MFPLSSFPLRYILLRSSPCHFPILSSIISYQISKYSCKHWTAAVAPYWRTPQKRPSHPHSVLTPHWWYSSGLLTIQNLNPLTTALLNAQLRLLGFLRNKSFYSTKSNRSNRQCSLHVAFQTNLRRLGWMWNSSFLTKECKKLYWIG